jgi:hypothetical protein
VAHLLSLRWSCWGSAASNRWDSAASKCWVPKLAVALVALDFKFAPSVKSNTMD